ncbi:tetratricopeptide repeat protein [Portibacter marinus]|uniref:tetratricopeptide repeat protein n=1 Tax=Portibacter marinus TaxID=2898660 RepID=UPI001F30F77D|nr:tetratricopeptide repeat protein [Portibacter marinus]
MVQKKVQKNLNWLNDSRSRIILIFVLGFVLYANTLTHDFTLDDAIVITDNEFTQKGFAGLKDIFTKDTFHGFFGEAGKDKLVSGGRYRPFTLAMFAIEHAIFGNNPFIHRFINILLYGLLSVLIYLFCNRIFSQKFDVQVAGILAFAISLLFIAHPIHTEAVTNIKGRDEIMAMLGSLAALFILVRKGFEDLEIKDYVLSSLLFLVALLSKENAITFVAVAPLVAFVFYKNPLKTGFLFLATAVLFLVIRTAVIGFDLGAAPSAEFMNNPYLKVESGQYVPFTTSEKLATIFHTLLKYIQLLFVPWPLTHDYYPGHIGLKTWSSPTAVLGLLVYLALAIASVVGIWRKKTWAFFTAYYLVTISIVSNLVFPIGTHMSERFVFMPSLGFAGVLSILIFKLDRRLAFAGLFLIIGLYSFGTIKRNAVWKDNFTLFTTDALTSVNSAKVNNAAGGAISDHVKEMPDSPEKTALIERGHEHLSRALEIHPNYVNAYLLKGNLYFYQEKFDEAIAMYDMSLRLDPNYADALRNKFLALRSAGRYQGEKLNNLSKSLEYLERAIEMQPNDFETNRLLGTCYGIMGKHELALKYFKKCSELQPNNGAIFVNLAKAYQFVGEEEKAQQAAARAQELGSTL